MKSLVDPDVMTLFSKDDRRVCVRKPSETDLTLGIQLDADEEATFFEYRSTSREVSERLDVMGFTSRKAEEWFADGAEYEAEMHQRWREVSMLHRNASDMSTNERPSETVKYSEFLRGLQFGVWLDAVRHVMEYPQEQELEEEVGETEHMMLAYVRRKYGYGEEPFGFPNATEAPFRIIVRALLEAVGPNAEVILNYTELVGGGWYSEDDDVRDLALQELRKECVVSERLVVLTEGSSDAQVLGRTLEVRYPHLKDHISFPDFHGSNVEGGTGALVNLVKGFASSGVLNRIVALFDNDAAGDNARQKLDEIDLPKNIRVLSLPPLEYARKYPTIGPQGRVGLDVNGSACSLELYFGRDVLEEHDGSLTPVKWGGLVQGLGRYQGAVVGKSGLRRKYLHALSQSAVSREAWEQHDWRPMEDVFQAIFMAFER